MKNKNIIYFLTVWFLWIVLLYSAFTQFDQSIQFSNHSLFVPPSDFRPCSDGHPLWQIFRKPIMHFFHKSSTWSSTNIVTLSCIEPPLKMGIPEDNHTENRPQTTHTSPVITESDARCTWHTPFIYVGYENRQHIYNTTDELFFPPISSFQSVGDLQVGTNRQL